MTDNRSATARVPLVAYLELGVCEVSRMAGWLVWVRCRIRSMEGRIHRVADTRQPDVWMAWGETVPAAGNGR